MAWIIEDNRKKYKVRCPNCGSIVGFTSVDEMANGREYFGEYHKDVQPVKNTSLLALMEKDWMWNLYDIVKNIVLIWNYRWV